MMYFNVLRNGEPWKKFEADLFNPELAPEKAFIGIRKMWNAVCTSRDKSLKYHSYRINIDVNDEVARAISLQLNLSQFLITMSNYINLRVPKAVGLLALREIFMKNMLCMNAIATKLEDPADMEPYVVDWYNVFDINFYTIDQWNEFSMNGICNAGNLIQYRFNDYRIVIASFYQCDATLYVPMAWVNPYILRAFLKSTDSNIAISNLQLYAYSFMMVAAFHTKGIVEESLVEQLWIALQSFIESNDSEILMERYKEARLLLAAKPANNPTSY